MPEPVAVDVDGRRLRLTSLDKTLYPSTGFTKGDAIDYWSRVAPVLLPLVAGRPATRRRWPDGVGTAGHPRAPILVKNLEAHAPDWVRTGRIAGETRDNRYPVVDDEATLVWLGQLAALELHVPQWRFDGEHRANPDRMVLDLDPGEGAGLAECAEVARLLRPLLTGMGLDPLPVTSGSKGIHLYAALDGRATSDQVAETAHELARALEADHPDLVVSDMKKALRTGRVLVDWSQNRAAKTTIAPYSLRGSLEPRAAAPRTWAELDDPDLAQLDPRQVLARIDADGDLLAPLHRGGARVAATPDRLTAYRAKRDAARTPEPVPVAPPATGRGDAFVIQEHHARALHWDFRLEHGGVLVSWALPRGVPRPGERDRLAVHTEDHPLEYGVFEGEIPAGEYGGGRVSIWDAGVYEAEKWRDDEVIAVLHGRAGGGLGGEPVRVALIRRGAGRHRDRDADPHAGESWLIHRMAPPEAADPADGGAARPTPAAGPTTRPGGAPAPAPAPMLATRLGPDGLDPDAAWSLELKWDGVRAIAAVRGGAVVLTSRSGEDLTRTYPELAVLADRVDGDAVLDGEVIALDPAGRPSFGRLQQRHGLTRPADVTRARAAVPVRYVLFDVLRAGGDDVTALPLRERRALLERLVRPGGGIDVPGAIGEARGPDAGRELDAALAASARLGLEGVVAKRLDGAYRPGRRSTDWLKRKNERQQEVVVAGWRPGGGARAGRVGSLLLGIPDGEALRYVGRVGTGFSDADLDAAAARLAPLARDSAPVVDVPPADARDARWVDPRLVGEVRFAEWTGAGRLRQASWRGWRDDKRPEEVVRES